MLVVALFIVDFTLECNQTQIYKYRLLQKQMVALFENVFIGIYEDMIFGINFSRRF